MKNSRPVQVLTRYHLLGTMPTEVGRVSNSGTAK